MAEAPENTRAAFERALDCGADGIELDVRFTTDRVPVICHDATLEKIGGSNRPISELSYEELKGLDWGGWFSHRFSGERVMTLDMVLSDYGSRTRLFIEIKNSEPTDRQSDAELAMVAAGRIRALVSQRQKPNIFILSFDPHILNAAFSENPEISYVLNLENMENCEAAFNETRARLSGCCLEFHLLTPGVMTKFQRRNLKTMTYSCNTPREVKQAADLGVNVIMTDHPAAVLNVID